MIPDWSLYRTSTNHDQVLRIFLQRGYDGVQPKKNFKDLMRGRPDILLKIKNNIRDITDIQDFASNIWRIAVAIWIPRSQLTINRNLQEGYLYLICNPIVIVTRV